MVTDSTKLLKAGVAVQVIEQTGRPVRAILSKASTLKADYIVIGSHGHRAAYDLLVGHPRLGVRYHGLEFCHYASPLRAN